MRVDLMQRGCALGVMTICVGVASGGSPVSDAGLEHLPRYLTDAERVMIDEVPIRAIGGRMVAPAGPIVCPAEYDPADAIIVSWIGLSSWLNILAEMGGEITTVGDAELHVIHETTSARNDAQSRLANAGANMSRVKFFQINIDSIWVRDYGPRFIYEGGVRTIVDHTYNRPRFQDNAMPSAYAEDEEIVRYDLALVHGGGNFHLFSPDVSYATELIENENPGLSSAQIISLWQQYQALTTLLTDAFPTSVDATQHIDMWMIPVSDTSVIVSDWPAQPGSIQDMICDSFAGTLQGIGYTVFRVPARTSGGTHYTYTNSVICNDLVLIPSYTNGAIAQYNSTALSTWQSALPGKTIVQVNCENIVWAAGVMHCIVKHVPANSGGADPVVYLRTPNGGESYDPGESVSIEWISDDDVSVDSIEILLSTDGGETYSETIATGLTERNGIHEWIVPDVFTNSGIIRVVAEDGDGNLGFDVSDAKFGINGVQPNPCSGDVNGDLVTDLSDFNILGINFGTESGAQPEDGDLNDDGAVDLSDFNILGIDFGCGT